MSYIYSGGNNLQIQGQRELKPRTEQGEGCQDPRETRLKPPLMVSILFHLFRAGENCFITLSITCPTPLVLVCTFRSSLHLSASCPIVTDSQNWRGPTWALTSTPLQCRSPLMANKFTCNFCLDHFITRQWRPCDIACSIVG